MRAAVYSRYGPPEVLQVKEVERPTIKEDEVLVRVHASTVTPLDYRFRNGKTLLARLFMTGLLRPKVRVLGVEMAGEVVKVGNRVKHLKVGDQVYGGGRPGAHAEFMSIPEEKLAIKPSNMTYEEAGAVPFGAVTSLRFLQDLGRIEKGQRVLINGASGGVGTFAVQVAKHIGAEVTGVCSTTNVDMVRSLGADKVIDYTKEDFTKSGQTYDIIFDAVGKGSFSICKGSLKRGGRYLSTVLSLPLLFQMLGTKIAGNKKARFALPPLVTKDLDLIRQLIEDEKVRTVIDRKCSLDQIVEAHWYVEKGHTKGKLVITID